MTSTNQSKSGNYPIQLDHIIILVSPQDFTNPPTWLTSNFTIIEGGTHSRGTSRNKLIIFKDGTYLELFSWTDPQPAGVPPHADFPSWADKPEGCIIDWALTGEDARAKYADLTRSLGELKGSDASVSVTYDEPREGGRQRKDGKELKWVTTRPSMNTHGDTSTSSSTSPSTSIPIPFFCHDITNRTLRVPHTPNAIPNQPNITSHPCGATGIAGLVIEVAESHLESATKIYEAILGHHHPAIRKDSASIFNVDVPCATMGDATEAQGQVQTQGCSIYLQIPDDEHMNRSATAKQGTSIKRLVLFTETEERRGEQIDREGFGTAINLC